MSDTPQPAYGYFETIPIEQVVARTKVRLQLKEISDFDGEIELFINEALASLGTKYNFIKKNCRIEITDGKARLPRGFKKLLGLRTIPVVPTTTLNTNTANIFNTTLPWAGEQLYLETTFLANCQSDPSILSSGIPIYSLSGSIEIVGGMVNFPIPCPFEAAVISYMGYATTEDCVMEVKAAYERALSEYAVWKMLSTYEQIKSEDRNREARLIEAHEDWVLQRKKIVSDGFADDWELNKYQMTRLLNALLQGQNYFSQTS